MIRLTSLELRNFKNIREGNIVLSSWSTKRSLPGSDIIGIYGQNGSGKTSVIQALAVLKNIFYGATFRDLPPIVFPRSSAMRKPKMQGYALRR